MPPWRQLRLRDADVAGEGAVFEADRDGDEAAHDPSVGVANAERRRVLGREAEGFDRDVIMFQLQRLQAMFDFRSRY